MNSQQLLRLMTRLPSTQASLRMTRLVPATSSTFCTQTKPAAKVAVQQPLKAEQVVVPLAGNHANLSVMSVLKGLKDSPSPALIYGLSGLIPFVAVPIYTISSGTFCPLMGSMQLYYGASILSFLGGVRWGNALKTPQELSMKNLGFSVVPSLAACGALALPYAPGMLAVTTGLGGVAYLDLCTANSSYPPWFKSMRLVLSSVAVASLLSALILSYTHKKKEQAPTDAQK